MIDNGLYEQLINQAINKSVPAGQRNTREVPEEVAADVLSRYVGALVRDAIIEKGKDSSTMREEGVHIVNALLETLSKETECDLSEKKIAVFPEEKTNLPRLPQELLNVFNPTALGLKQHFPRPLTSMSRTSLLTGDSSVSLLGEIKAEIATADRIDLLVSFFRQSGITPLLDALEEFCLARNGKVRIVTTTYIGATQIEAIDALKRIPGVEIHIELNGKASRHHAKAYIFYRKSGYSTAYVGSSNVSHPAMTSGLEWNVKLTQAENPDVFQTICDTFETYWENIKTYQIYDGQVLSRNLLEKTLNASRKCRENGTQNLTETEFYYFDLEPHQFQAKIIEDLQYEQRHGRFKHLVVAATGTGKTMIAAFYYQSLQKDFQRLPRLLFLAHRAEIIKQACHAFRSVLKFPRFGELLDGNHVPQSEDYLFATVQSLKAQEAYQQFERNFYDVIIVDEAHHVSEGSSYDGILSYFDPKVLVGLTATPERMDGKSILPYFGGSPSAEIRLPDAIDLKLLCPFNYFVIRDTVNPKEVLFKAGKYDIQQLTDLYLHSVGGDKRFKVIKDALERYCPYGPHLHAVAFCVSVEHAKFMATAFSKNRDLAALNLRAECITGNMSEAERQAVRGRFENGQTQVITAVDVLSEGVDIPYLNVVLLLRPTESLTVYLQQLGRGLRNHPGKDALTVLDFVGEANERFSFEQRYRSLIRKTGGRFKTQIEHDFPSLPTGCSFTMQKEAQEIILRNIKENFDGLHSLSRHVQWWLDDNPKQSPLLSDFLAESEITPLELYRMARSVGSFAGVVARVKNEEVPSLAEFSNLSSMAQAFIRLSLQNDKELLDFWMQLLSHNNAYTNLLDDPRLKMWRRIFFPSEKKKEDLELLETVKNTPWLREEIYQLLQYLAKKNRILQPISWGFACPIKLHGTYTRAEILACFPDVSQVSQSGVEYSEICKTYIFFITINKSENLFVPSVRFDDRAIDENLFHWQSQNKTRIDSETGQNFIHQRERGIKIALFSRTTKYQLGSSETAPYTCLGLADFVRHNGEKPMNIIWKLRDPLSAELLSQCQPVQTF